MSIHVGDKIERKVNDTVGIVTAIHTKVISKGNWVVVFNDENEAIDGKWEPRSDITVDVSIFTKDGAGLLIYDSNVTISASLLETFKKESKSEK